MICLFDESQVGFTKHLKSPPVSATFDFAALVFLSFVMAAG